MRHARRVSRRTCRRPLGQARRVDLDDRGARQLRLGLDGNGSYETDTGTTGMLSHTFATAGAHTVGVKVTAPGGAFATRRISIPVDAAPVAAFKVTPTAPVHGQAATLDASASSHPDGTIVRCQWDLDGAGGYEVDAGASAVRSHTFPTAGRRTVRLRVTDDRGAVPVKALAVTVS